MKMLKVIEKRRSVREYKDKALSSKDLQAVMSYCDTYPKLSEKTDVAFKFLEDGSDVASKLDGVAGYSGVMIKAPHYLLVTASASETAYEAAGYAGEYVILNATKHNVGTCWIDGVGQSDKIKELLNISSDQLVIGLIALGYAQYEPRLAKIYDTNMEGSVSPLTDLGYPNIDPEYSKEPVSNRLSIEDISYLKKWGVAVNSEELQKRGYDQVFYYMRMAPSWGNRQPWRFVLDGTKIVLIMERDDRVDDRAEEVEAGIAMLYFEVAMHDIGLPGSWKTDDLADASKYEVPENHFIGGYYTF